MKIADGERFDVVVCGGGPAGFTAAVASARNGARTALVEKYASPGGILTVLGNNVLSEFNNPHSQGDKMVIKGIGWEYVRRLQRAGFATAPDMGAPLRSYQQYDIRVNPIAAAKFMDDMLLEAGVRLFYNQPIVECEVMDGTVKSVIITTKTGLRRLYADCFIDCTGDGDLAFYAGAEYELGGEAGELQPGTIRYYPLVSEDPDTTTPVSPGDNTNHIGSYNSADSESSTNAEIRARTYLYEQMKLGRARGEHTQYIGMAPAVAPRESRRIVCDNRMNAADYMAGTVFFDSICFSYWFIDIHRDDEEAVIQYIESERTPTIRLSAMLVKGLTNLCVAGRCVSSDRETNSALRVKASCMAMGEAIGTVSALAVARHVPVRSVNISDLRRLLLENGAVVPIPSINAPK